MLESPAIIAAEAAALFELHGAALYRFALVMLRRAEDAEDVVQNTFVRLMEHLSRGAKDSNIRAWLFTVTANLARDRLRSRRRWLPWNLVVESQLVTGAELDTRDPQQQFLAVVSKLGPRDRLLLALKAQGLSYREIAQAADIRETSVGRLLARALLRWRREQQAASLT